MIPYEPMQPNTPTTELTTIPVGAIVAIDEAKLIRFSVEESVIADLSHRHTGLTIAGVDDKEGYDRVHAARMEVRKWRTGLESDRKGKKRILLDAGKRLDVEADRLEALLLAIETPLDKEETRIDDERKAIKTAVELAKKAKLDGRMREIQALNMQADPSAVDAMTDDEFAAKMVTARERFDVKKAEEKAAADKKAQEETDAKTAREAEAERLRLQKIELDRQAAELKKQTDAAEAQRKADADRVADQQRQLDADRKKLEDEKAAKVRADELEKAKAEGAAKAKKEAADKAARDKAADELKERKRKDAEARRQARMSDAGKLDQFAKQLEELVLPKLTDEALGTELGRVMGNVVVRLRTLAKDHVA